MRYNLLMHHFEPGPGQLSADTIQEGMRAFSAFGQALAKAGVLVGGEVLQPSSTTTTITRRNKSLQVQDGPFIETKEYLAGIFTIDVPDLDSAIGWAEKCPGAEWGSVEVRTSSTSLLSDGTWTPNQ